MLDVTFRAMGCQMAAYLDTDTPGAAAALAEVPRWFETWEQTLSRFRLDSELCRLNARTGQRVRVSEVLWEVVGLALRVACQSEGRVVPTLLGALERAGYDRPFDEVTAGTVAAPPAVAAGAPAEAWRAIRRRRHERTLELPAGTRLDLGGVAKGWAAAQAAQALSGWGPALVDAGGDVAVSGARTGGQGWSVGVADPRQPGGGLAVLKLMAGGVATSGRDYRRWQRDGQQQHHLLDAATGLPAQTDVLTATVLAPDLWQAEMAAKRVLLAGAQAGLAWLDARPELAGLVVVENSPEPIRASQRLAEHLWS
jgi:FAD:protein FMN transferase